MDNQIAQKKQFSGQKIFAEAGAAARIVVVSEVAAKNPHFFKIAFKNKISLFYTRWACATIDVIESALEPKKILKEKQHTVQLDLTTKNYQNGALNWTNL